jgi:phosphatidylglycerol---prolipoprotein diacylglyceryl transferase
MEFLQTSPYLLLNGIGFIVALFSVDHRPDQRLPERRDVAYVLLVVSVVVGWFGARVLDWLVGFQPFSRAGFTFYGGLIAAVTAFVLSGLKVMSARELAVAVEVSTVPLVIAHGIGRIGCFFAGCCNGKMIGATTFRHPTQLYESGFLLLFAVGLVRFRSQRPFRDVMAYLLCYPTFRFAIEFLRDDPRGEAFGLSTSQWISLGLFLCGAFVLLRYREVFTVSMAAEGVRRSP